MTQADTPEQVQELLQSLPQNSLLQRLGATTTGPVSDKIVAHLALEAQTDPALKISLSRSLAKVSDVPTRTLVRTFQFSRHSLSKDTAGPPKSKYRKGDQYYDEAENTYVQDWVRGRHVPLNNQSDGAKRKGPTGQNSIRSYMTSWERRRCTGIFMVNTNSTQGSTT